MVALGVAGPATLPINANMTTGDHGSSTTKALDPTQVPRSDSIEVLQVEVKSGRIARQTCQPPSQLSWVWFSFALWYCYGSRTKTNKVTNALLDSAASRAFISKDSRFTICVRRTRPQNRTKKTPQKNHTHRETHRKKRKMLMAIYLA